MANKNANPLFTMWFRPMITIRNIVKTNPKMGFFFLGSIWFLQFFFILQTYYSINFPTHWIVSLIIAIIIAPFIGAIAFYFFGWILYFTGKWLGGKAPQLHTRCAFAWSRVPLIIDLIMWFVISFFVAEIIFVTAPIGMSFIFINLVTYATAIWSFILLVGAIREIQKFSVGKAIFNVILAYLIFLFLFVIFRIIF